MKRRDRYELAPRKIRSGRSVAGASRYLMHIFLFVIIAGVALVATTGLVASQTPDRPEVDEQRNVVLALPLGAPGVVPGPPGNDGPIIVGGLAGPDPEVIQRDFVLGADAAAPVTNRPRELGTYTVVSGDTVFGIALKFGLRPETILWSNYNTLKDNFDLISIGQQFTIPPEDGLIVEVEVGDTIDGLARRYRVDPASILGEPVNKLSDLNQPLGIGQVIFVPGGERETVVWQVPKPVEVRRTATGVRVYRVGVCGEVAIPSLGSGTFIYPTNRRYLSGYNFGRYHPGLDFAGRLGEPIYASDAGTVIYAGYSLNAAGAPVGYGQYVVLDHGNGYQTLYAHASQLFVRCGQQVQRGAVIAAIGSIGRSTGPHLHYEIRNGGTAVNPWSVLPRQ
jgi:murein DD-endopeptidase MepM/ murein hydrolase activator NlpD